MKEVAYRQAARLSKIPDDISAEIRRALLSLFSAKRLKKEFFATYAHLSRLDSSAKYINVLRLLKWIGSIDIWLHIVLFSFLLIVFSQFYSPIIMLFIIILFWTYSTLRLFSSAVTSIRFSLDEFSWNRIFSSMRFDRYRMRAIDSGISLYFKNIKKNIPENNFFLSLMLSVYPRLFLFPLLWSIFAILAANTGQFTHPLWWPFLLSFPLLYFIYKFRNFIKICISILGNVWTYVILFGYLFSWYFVDWIFDNPNTTPARIVFGFVGISGVFFLFLLSIIISQRFNQWVQDRSQWKKWVKSHPATMTAQDLLNFMNLYHNKTFCKQLIIVSREQNLLPANKDSEELLNELAMALEYSLFLVNRKADIRQRARQRLGSRRQKTWRKILKYLGNATKLLLNKLKFLRTSKKASRKLKKTQIEKIIETYSGSEFFSTWLKQYTRKNKTRFIELGSEFLDEVYILLEQLHAKRKVSERSE